MAGAGVTEAGFLVGTPHYLAPEQIQGREPSFATDLYAVGVVLYELFTGTLPFGGGNPMEILLKHLSDAPVPPRERWPEIPPSASSGCSCAAWRRTRSARFAKVDELQRELDQLLDLRLPAARRGSAGDRGVRRVPGSGERRTPRRRRSGLGVARARRRRRRRSVHAARRAPPGSPGAPLRAAARGSEEARDAAQEVFLKVFRQAASFRPEGQVFTWIYRIAVNHCLNRLRRRRVLRFFSLAAEAGEDGGSAAFDPVDGAPDAFAALDARRRWAATRQAIDALPAGQRAVLVLAKFEGLSYREIARDSGDHRGGGGEPAGAGDAAADRGAGIAPPAGFSERGLTMDEGRNRELMRRVVGALPPAEEAALAGRIGEDPEAAARLESWRAAWR